MEVLILYLCLILHLTWAIGSRTRLEHYRICKYKEINSESDQTYTWYLPWPNSYCDPYVIYEVTND